MTWSNVGDEPGFKAVAKLAPMPPKGRVVRVKGGPAKIGNRHAESGPARAARLRALARGGQP